MNLDDLFDEPPRRKRRKRDDDFLSDLDLGFDDPTPGELRQQRAEERRFVSPEEEQSILGKASDVALSGLGWFGEVLDKYSGDRAIRGLLAGKPRELASIVPFSDDLGITRREDLTTGEDLNEQVFGLKKDNSWTSMGAGMATELGLGLLNPVSWVGSAAEALTPAGKIAKMTGLADNAVSVANSKLRQAAGKTGEVARKMGGFEAQMSTTLRDLIDGSDDAVEALGRAKSAADTAGHNLDDLLDQPLGHRLGIKDWTGEVTGALPGFAAGDELGRSVARMSDAASETIFGELPSWVPGFGGSSPLRNLQSLFDPRVDQAVTKEGQEAIGPRTNTAWLNEQGYQQHALEGLDLARSLGVDEDTYLSALEESGPFSSVFKLADGAVPEPYQQHAIPFGKEAAARRAKSTTTAFDLEGAMKAASEAKDEAATAAYAKFLANEVDYDGLRKVIPGLPERSAAELSRLQAGILADMGEYANPYPEVVASALKKGLRPTQEAIHSAEELAPGKVARLVPRFASEAYKNLPEPVLNHLKTTAKQQQKWMDDMMKEGVNPHYLSDAEMSGYAHRQALKPGGPDLTTTELGGEWYNNIAARESHMKHFPGGTPALKEMLKDVAERSEGNVSTMRDILKDDYSDELIQQVKNEARMAGKNLTDTELATAYQGRMKQLVESLASATPEQRAAGYFGNHAAVDHLTYQKMQNGRLAVVKAAKSAIASHLQPLLKNDWKPRGGLDGEGVKISEVWKKLGINPGAAADETGGIRALAKELGYEVPTDAKEFAALRKTLENATIPQDLAKDILRLHGKLELPDNVQSVVSAFDSMTQFFKSFTLAHPATKVRDAVSGQLQSAILGNWSYKNMTDVYGLLTGAKSDTWKRLKPVQEILERQGIDPKLATAEQTTNAMMTFAGSLDRAMQGQTSEVMRKGGASAEEVLARRPGATPASLAGAYQDATKHYSGVGSLPGDLFTLENAFGATETKNPIVRASNYTGEFTDRLNRLVPLVSLLDQGYSPAAAEARVMLQQVDYSAKALGKAEQTYLARLFPFYKFTRGMAKQLATELWERPTGSMAKVIKGQAALARQDEGEFIPSHISQTMAIPLGGDEKNKSFLTGLGLMHEDVFNLARPGAGAYDTVQGLLQEVGGRMTPWAKAPMEIATGTQLYSGRDLRDLEGGLGRMLGNVTGQERAVEIPILAEEALSMSPFSRAVSSTRTAFDPRKDLVQKILNLGTGVRTETVDVEKARQVETRRILETLLRGKPGVLAFEHLYSTDDELLSPEDQALMRMYRKGSYEQQKAKREAKKPPVDELEELLGL